MSMTLFVSIDGESGGLVNTIVKCDNLVTLITSVGAMLMEGPEEGAFETDGAFVGGNEGCRVGLPEGC